MHLYSSLPEGNTRAEADRVSYNGHHHALQLTNHRHGSGSFKLEKHNPMRSRNSSLCGQAKGREHHRRRRKIGIRSWGVAVGFSSGYDAGALRNSGNGRREGRWERASRTKVLSGTDGGTNSKWMVGDDADNGRKALSRTDRRDRTVGGGRWTRLGGW